MTPVQDFHRSALTATAAHSLVADARLPWPKDFAPKAAPVEDVHDQCSLERFQGYDAVVVAWTSAEADTLAALFTPGKPLSTWYEYRYHLNEYLPLVTGEKAPFNAKDQPRYYRSLGLYMPARIGSARVLCMKSGLHLAYDGPAVPVRKLMAEIAQTVRPKLFVTTGTGGGIGASVKLGDVVIAGKVRFDCTGQFKREKWAHAAYEAPRLPPGMTKLITEALTAPNTSRIPDARAVPKIWSGPSNACVTTDTFAFDDSSDHCKLQGKGRVYDMGDAMVAQALKGFPKTRWYSIRNASDPQIPNPSGNIEAASKQAEGIYSEYGALTTANSVIATWALICAAIKPEAA